MPLPVALMARLQKRGIVKRSAETGREVPDIYDAQPPAKTARPGEEEEEVFAEDYGDLTGGDQPGGGASIGPRLPAAHEKALQAPNELLDTPAIGCPNKWNAHHRCVGWCLTRWGQGKGSESASMTRRRLEMLRKYPLPPEWNESFDPGTGRYYYWHQDGQQTCWLSPRHPRAEIVVPAQKFREILATGDDDEDEESGESGASEPEEEAPPHKDRHHRNNKDFRHKDRRGGGGGGAKRGGRRGGGKDDTLDPMDPAAYSETCPRGGWSDGLERQAGAGGGAADTTAAGPLFQQRPYPSPGDVLRMNKPKKDGNDSD